MTCIVSPLPCQYAAIHIEAEAARKIAFMQPLEDSTIAMVSIKLIVQGSLPAGMLLWVMACFKASLHLSCRYADVKN